MSQAVVAINDGNNEGATIFVKLDCTFHNRKGEMFAQVDLDADDIALITEAAIAKRATK